MISQEQKNIFLIMSLVIISTVAVMLHLWSDSPISNDDRKKFVVEDTASILKISIESKAENNIITQVNHQWIINERYEVDPSMSEVLKSILFRIRIKQLVKSTGKVDSLFQLNEYKVKVYLPDDELAFSASGIREKNKSYFKQDGKIYEVYLPGYTSYVTGIFEIPEHDWRDRTIIHSSWRTIDTLAVKYPRSKEDFQIIYQGEFFEIPEIHQIDTSQLIVYLDKLYLFSADSYIPAREQKKYKELITTETPLAKLLLSDMNPSRSVAISFFSYKESEEYILGYDKEHEDMFLIHRERIKTIFRKKNYFESKK